MLMAAAAGPRPPRRAPRLLAGEGAAPTSSESSAGERRCNAAPEVCTWSPWPRGDTRAGRPSRRGRGAGVPATGPAQPEPSQQAGPADVDRDGAEATRRAAEVDVGDAPDAPAGDVDDLRIEDIAAEPEAFATGSARAVRSPSTTPVGSNVRTRPHGTSSSCR